MNFNEFVNEVKDNIKLFLPRDYENAEVSTMECHKLNRAYTGLMVRKEGEMLTPTINLNRLYEAYKAQPGVTMETVCRKIADIVIEAPIQVDLKAILNYEDVKDKLFIRVSSAEANKEVLEIVPHQLKEDLAITYHVAVGKNQDGLSSMLITNEMMKEYGVTQEQIHADVKKYIFDEILPAEMVDENTKFFINPTGRFVIGGPHGDSGVTGRKIIVDTYGGMARHGGGAFSGKDCTKVDRSASYAARYVAKNIVAAGLAKKCEIQLSYAIGVAHPTSIMVDTFGTGKISDESLVEMIRREFDLRPAGIIQMLDLRRPIYKQTAAYGHFGRNDLNLPWERLDKVEELKKYLK